MTKTKINLHNNYKVKVIGSNGEIKDEGYAENTVLNGFWDRVDDWNIDPANQFTNIRIGTGSPVGNEVDPSRTTLYNQIGGTIQGTNPIIESNLSNNVRISSKVMTCTIPATFEYEGEITEIGCGCGNYLNSLALFKDSEGNPISIDKSSEDVMIVEVTVYVVINYAEDIIPINEIDSISNTILNGSGGIFYNSYYDCKHYIALTTNREAFKVDNYNPFDNNMSRLGSITIPRPNDRVLKNSREVIFDKVRTNDTYGNLGFANYITIQGLGSVKLPNENYFSKYFISDIEVGEGDGVKTEFSFPIPEFIVDTDVIKVDGVPLERDIDYTLAHDNNSLAYSSSFASMKENYTITDGDIDPFIYDDMDNDETYRGEAYIVYEEDIYVDCYKVKTSYDSITVSYSVDGENYVEAFDYDSETSGTIVELGEPIEAKYWKIEGELGYSDRDALAFGKKPTHLVFTNPPAQGAKITATMQVDRPFKSDDFILDTSFKMSY